MWSLLWWDQAIGETWVTSGKADFKIGNHFKIFAEIAPPARETFWGQRFLLVGDLESMSLKVVPVWACFVPNHDLDDLDAHDDDDLDDHDHDYLDDDDDDDLAAAALDVDEDEEGENGGGDHWGFHSRQHYHWRQEGLG